MTGTKKLVETITKGIQEKKGSNIVIADLKHIDGAIARYFIICQGNSPIQVEAIAESVGETVRKEMNEKPVHVVGLGVNQWVAMDFTDVLVHIFYRKHVSFTILSIFGMTQNLRNWQMLADFGTAFDNQNILSKE